MVADNRDALAALFPPSNEASVKLDLDGLDREFDKAWFQLKRRFFKLETLQQYDETGTPVYDAWMNGDTARLQELARQRVEDQSEIYDYLRAHGVEFVRLRILRLPVSEYVRFESEVYRYATEAGETILGINEAELPSEHQGRLIDYLLFDDSTVLVHDYDSAAVLNGSWLIEKRDRVKKYEDVAEELLKLAEPFDRLAERYF